MANLSIEFKGNGVIKISSKQYNFKCFSVPRNSISTNIPGLETSMFVYFLVDSFQGKREKRKLYVGQTAKGMRRFFDHKGKKEWWDRVYIFTADKCVFDTDTIKGLENLFINKYKATNLYEMDQEGSEWEISEDCLFFAEQMEEVLDFLGYGLSLEESNDDEETEVPISKEISTSAQDSNSLFKKLDKAIKEINSNIKADPRKLYTAYMLDKDNICAVWVRSKSLEVELYAQLSDVTYRKEKFYDTTSRARGNKKVAIKIESDADIEALIPAVQTIINKF